MKHAYKFYERFECYTNFIPKRLDLKLILVLGPSSRWIKQILRHVWNSMASPLLDGPSIYVYLNC